jgi:Flp pilus assembly protein TadD
MRLLSLALCALLAFGCAAQKKAQAQLRAAAGNTDAPGVRRTLARVMISEGKYEEALRQLRAASKDEGKKPSAKTSLLIGIALRELGFYPESSESLERALSLDARDPETWDALGILEQLMGRPDSAQRRFWAACLYGPDNPEYQNNLGFSLYLAGRYEEAGEAARRSVSLAPDNPRFRNNLGFILGALGRDQEARESFRAAVPEAMAENNLGVVFERRGEAQKAEQSYLAALALDPALAEAQRNLSRLKTKTSAPAPRNTSTQENP